MKNVVMSLALAALLVPYVSAAQYTLEGTDITLDFPDDAYVITPSTPLDDPMWSELGVTDPSPAIDSLKSSGHLVDLLFDDLSFEIVVGSNIISDSYSTSLSDFTSGSEEDLSEIYGAVDDAVDGTGMTVQNTYICRDFSYPFLVGDLTQSYNGITVRSRQYYTWVNSRSLYVTLHRFDGDPVSVEQDQILRSIVKTVKFPEQAESSASAQSAGSAPAENEAPPDDYGILPRVLGGALMGAFFGVIGVLIARARGKEK